MELLTNTNHGLYCPQADVYIDPWKRVKKALITHGHSDHARPGHQQYLCHTKSVAILKHRLGKAITVQGVDYNECIRINGVQFSFHPAGHIIGSCQIRVEYKGEVWVITGDYKTQDDGVCTPYEVVQCHTMITECTFGLPVFRWEAQEKVAKNINAWCLENERNGETSLIYAYSLGKAQRVHALLEEGIAQVYTHPTVYKTNEVLLEQHLFDRTSICFDKDHFPKKGGIIIAPVAFSRSNWVKKNRKLQEAMVSGWMQMRGTRRRQGLDQGFVLSDHADWKGLLMAVKESKAERVIATHGYQDVFAKYCTELGLQGETYDTAFEGETVDV